MIKLLNVSLQMAELQKQIQEERQIQELRALQVASGQAIKHTDTTMDWMYEGPSAQSAQSTEEFLLGKIYKPQGGGRDADALPSKYSLLLSVPCWLIHYCLLLAKEPGSLWMNKVSTKNDSFTRLHEDPMLAIKRLEKSVRRVSATSFVHCSFVNFQARENVLNNPVKMARIKMRIAREIEEAEEKSIDPENTVGVAAGAAIGTGGGRIDHLGAVGAAAESAIMAMRIATMGRRDGEVLRPVAKTDILRTVAVIAGKFEKAMVSLNVATGRLIVHLDPAASDLILNWSPSAWLKMKRRKTGVRI